MKRNTFKEYIDTSVDYEGMLNLKAKNLKFNKNDEIIEVTIRDATGRRIEVRRSNKLDKVGNGKLLMWLMKKWDVKFKVSNELLDFDSDFLNL